MGLIRCIDCGKEFSNRLDNCPNCGCPIKYCLNSRQKQNDECIKFKMGEYSLSFPKGFDIFMKVDAPFELNASKFSIEMDKFYRQNVKKYEDLFDKCVPKMKEIFSTVSKGTVLMLNKAFDIDYIDEEYLSSKFIDYFDLEESLSSLTEAIQEVESATAEYLVQKEEGKNYSGSWVGGGFGIKGALKGAVKASILNLGSSALHKVTSGINNSCNSSKVRAIKEDVINRVSVLLAFCNTVYSGVCAYGELLCDILSSKGILPTFHWNKQSAEARVNNTMELFENGELSKEDSIYKICLSIQEYPKHLKYFKCLYEIEPNLEDDILAFSRLRGTQIEMERIIDNIDLGEEWSAYSYDFRMGLNLDDYN